MREILFHGKRLDNGEWVEGYYCTNPEWDRKTCGEHHWVISCKNGMRYEVDPSTIGQFTGLTDKNGRRIFEGDILEYNDGVDYFKGVVVYECGAFGIGFGKPMSIPNMCCDNFALLWQLYWDQEAPSEPELYYCEVIGNIHDNPELLEEANGTA